MMIYSTIKSRKLNRSFAFCMPHNGGYVRLTDDSHPGRLGQQICYGGGFRGNTVSSTPTAFVSDCREWYRQHMRQIDWRY